MRSPEGIEKDKIKKYLKERGAFYFCPYMAGRGGSGVPDIIACVAGLFVAIEVKRPGGKPTKLQWKRLEEISNANGIAVHGPAEQVIRNLETWISKKS